MKSGIVVIQSGLDFFYPHNQNVRLNRVTGAGRRTRFEWKRTKNRGLKKAGDSPAVKKKLRKPVQWNLFL